MKKMILLSFRPIFHSSILTDFSLIFSRKNEKLRDWAVYTILDNTRLRHKADRDKTLY